MKWDHWAECANANCLYRRRSSGAVVTFKKQILFDFFPSLEIEIEKIERQRRFHQYMKITEQITGLMHR